MAGAARKNLGLHEIEKTKNQQFPFLVFKTFIACKDKLNQYQRI